MQDVVSWHSAQCAAHGWQVPLFRCVPAGHEWYDVVLGAAGAAAVVRGGCDASVQAMQDVLSAAKTSPARQNRHCVALQSSQPLPHGRHVACWDVSVYAK